MRLSCIGNLSSGSTTKKHDDDGAPNWYGLQRCCFGGQGGAGASNRVRIVRTVFSVCRHFLLGPLYTDFLKNGEHYAHCAHFLSFPRGKRTVKIGNLSEPAAPAPVATSGGGERVAPSWRFCLPVRPRTSRYGWLCARPIWGCFRLGSPAPCASQVGLRAGDLTHLVWPLVRVWNKTRTIGSGFVAHRSEGRAAVAL